MFLVSKEGLDLVPILERLAIALDLPDLLIVTGDLLFEAIGFYFTSVKFACLLELKLD